MEQQVWSRQRARRSTLRPRVAATTKSDGMWERPPVFGMIQRGGQVVINMLANVQQKTIEPCILRIDTLSP
jgi:hypothetical protein